MKYFMIILLAYSVDVYSQCQFTQDKVDEFTGSRIVETEYEPLCRDLTTKLRMSFKRINASYYINITYGKTGRQDYLIVKDAKLMLKLRNGEVISVEAIDYFKTKRMAVTGSSELTWGEATYLATGDDLENIKKHGIEKVRIYFDEGYVEEEVIKVKFEDKVLNSLQCLLDAE